MRVVVDSSSFAKRYIQENGSERLDDLLQNVSELGLSVNSGLQCEYIGK